MSFNDTLQKGKKWTKKHSPELLTALGIGCFGASAILTGLGTVKAVKLIEEEKDRRFAEWPKSEITEEEEYNLLHFTPRDYISTCWKVYSPAVLTAVLGGICVINANRINVKRTAALTAAYTLSETALREFKNKAVEVVGEKKVDEIRHEIVKDRYEAMPVQDNEIIMTKKGTTLFCESISMRYFTMDINEIDKIENKINLVLRNENYCGLNTLYDYLGLEHTANSSLLGWNIERDGYLEIRKIPQLASNGEPCIYLDYSELPKYEYSKMYI